MRVCQYHGVYPHRLLELFDLPEMVDFDTDLRLPELRILTNGTAAKREKIFWLSRKVEHVRQGELAKAFMLAESSGRQYYRFCPECLVSDPIPYWRFTWRVTYTHFCEKHRCVLLTRCLACGERLAALGLWKRPFIENDLYSACRFCTACGEDLGTFPSQPIMRASYERLFDLQRLVIAAIVRGHFLVQGIKGPLPLELLPRAILMGAGVNTLSQSGVPIMFSVIRDFLMARSYKGKADVGGNDVHVWSKRAAQLRYGGVFSGDVWQR